MMLPLAALKTRLDRRVRTVALWGGGGLLVGLMALTVLDVVRRHGFNAPIYGARDVAKLMLLCLVALSVAYSARTGGRVAIELFTQRLAPPLRRRLAIGVRLLAIPMLTLLGWQLIDSGINARRFGEASLALQLPYAPFYAILAAGMALCAMVLVVEILLLSFLLLAVEMPIAMAMLITGFGGIALINGPAAAFSTLSGEAFEIATYLELSVTPSSS